MIRFLSILCLFGFLEISNGLGQCEIMDTLINIPDNEKPLGIKLVVEGVLNDDLSDPDQGVCRVYLRYEHQRRTELTIDLISPAGQVVRLVGPYNPWAVPSPGNRRWNINFFPCSNNVAPDPGKSQHFNNNDNWGLFVEFNGSYYPHDYCLEQFDTGNVNGTWTFLVYDHEKIYTGIIRGYAIEFCDGSVFDCNPCSPNAGYFTTDSLEFCANEPLNSLDFYYEFSDSIPDSLYYRYNYLIGKEGNLYKISDSLDLEGFTPGVYDIYGISYHINDSTALFELLNKIGFDHFVDSLSLEEAPFCSRLTAEPLIVTIHPVDTEYIIPVSLCEGEFYIFRDDTIYQTGIYFYKDLSNNCDTTWVLDVKVVELNPEILATATELTCHNNSVILRGEGFTDGVGMRFEWLEFPDSNQLELLITQPGTFHFVLSAGDCSDTASITITAADDIPLLEYSVQGIDCCYPDGIITVSVENVPVIAYEWSFEGSVLPVNSDQLISNISGNYSLTVISDIGCSAQVNFFLPIDTISPTATFDYNDITCRDESAKIILNSTSELTSINWIGHSGNSDTLTVFDSGTYYVEITSANCCRSLDSIVINSFTEKPEITVTKVEDLDCLIRSTELSFSSDSEITEFNWTTPDNIELQDNPVLVSIPGMFYIIVENEYGCKAVDSILVTEDADPPEIIFDSDPFVITCDADSVQLGFSSSSAVISIRWIGPDGFLSTERNPYVRYDGIYFLSVTGENHCVSNKAALVILDNTAPQIGVIADTLNCLGQEINVSAVYTGNYSFRWLVPNGTVMTGPDIVSPDAGVFYVTVTDLDNNCSSQFFIESVVDTVPIDLTLLSDNLLDCNHDFVDIYLNSYADISLLQWYNEDGTFSSVIDTATVFSPGKYYVEATGMNYCVAVDSFLVEEGEYILIRPDTFYITCSEPVAELSVPGATDDYSFIWSGPGGFSSVSPRPEADKGGNYLVEVSSGECVESTVIVVIEYKVLPDIELVYDSIIGCEPAYARLNGIIHDIDYSGFEWTGPGFINNTDLNLEITVPGTYLFAVTGNNGCIDTLYADITFSQENPEFDATGNSISCKNPAVMIRALGVEQHRDYYWEGPQGFYSTLTDPVVDMPGAYKLVVTGHNACRDSMIVYVAIDTIRPEFFITIIDSLDCENNKTILYVDSLLPNRQYTYHWSTDTGVIDFGNYSSQPGITGAGIYKITVTDILNGCEYTDSVELGFYVYQLDSLSLSILHPDCFGDSNGYIRVDKVHGGEGPYQFSTNNNDFTITNVFSGKKAGSYSIYVKDRFGCRTDTMIALNEGALVDVQLATDKNDVFPGTTVTIDPRVSSPNGISYAKWRPERYFFDKNDVIPVEIYPEESIYVTLEVTDTLGCSGQSSIWIMVKTQAEIFVPNIFTPDGDGINDHFYISVKNGVKSISDFKIFNRWGELMYSISYPGLNLPLDGWDGRYRGRIAPPGVYVVFFVVELENGTVESFYSDFTLIR